ncbi:hypothetical protein KIPE111705_31180 [Kibdelosporangium persicum]|uniref:Uncharacterized protein n=2 Tax=Kibdelosporangium persicum TaxID=2698649 RepID=A0ABX2EVA0_9PSEU|nr:hypothetical protein [Kibdelosporangium persicum]
MMAAAVLSGVPSTVHALLTGHDPLAATRAAATLIPGLPLRAHDPSHREFARGNPLISRYQEGLTVLGGVAVHLVVSAFWAAVIEAVDSRAKAGGSKLMRGAVAGLLIAALDLEIIGRRHPAVRALPRLPQWLDHVTFGVLVTALARPDGPASTALSIRPPSAVGRG